MAASFHKEDARVEGVPRETENFETRVRFLSTTGSSTRETSANELETCPGTPLPPWVLPFSNSIFWVWPLLIVQVPSIAISLFC